MKTDSLVGLAVLAALALPGRLDSQQRTPAVTITLEEAVARAYRHDPRIAQAAGAIRTAAAAERSTIGSFLPNVSFSAGSSLSSSERFNPTTNTTVTGSSDSYSAGLSASMRASAWSS